MQGATVLVHCYTPDCSVIIKIYTTLQRHVQLFIAHFFLLCTLVVRQYVITNE